MTAFLKTVFSGGRTGGSETPLRFLRQFHAKSGLLVVILRSTRDNQFLLCSGVFQWFSKIQDWYGLIWDFSWFSKKEKSLLDICNNVQKSNQHYNNVHKIGGVGRDTQKRCFSLKKIGRFLHLHFQCGFQTRNK